MPRAIHFALKLAASFAAVAVACLGTVANAQSAPTRPVHTAALNRDPQVEDAWQRFYNLDYDGSLAEFQRVEQQHPGEPLAVDYVLNVVVFRELYREDLLDTTLYAHEGFLTGKHIIAENMQVKAQVEQMSAQAVELATRRIQANPRDVDAWFARGMARSLYATYVGLAERAFISGLHMALQASDDDSHALQLDPDYVDAEMVPAIHDFVVGTLPFALKMMAGIVGIHGDKAKGMAMLEDCARRGVITNIESQTAEMIFLRHEARYADAIVVARRLAAQFPQDYLFALEVANLEKDAGHGPEAIRVYRSVLADAARPGYYASEHPELAWFGLGETLRGQNDLAGSMQAFQQAKSQPTTGPDMRFRAEQAIKDLRDRGVK